MPKSSDRELKLPGWGPIAGLIALVIGSTYTCLPNRFVQDDLPIIKVNPTLHTLAHPWNFFNQAYWPWPYPRELYRPLTSALLAIQWVAGGGHPVAFRIGSILLYLVATLAVYRLARRITRPEVAWVATAFFAVHPVHVEAVAVAVNQAEPLVAILLVVLVTAYLDRRRANAPLDGRWIGMMALGYLAASLFKEHGLMLPLLLVAAEVTLVADGRSWRQRAAALRFLFLVLALVGVSVVEVRNVVLHGNTRGSFIAEALVHSGIGGRALTMLGVVPQWYRLFFWPEHLRADYSPQVIVAATHWGMAQSLGALLLIGTGWLAWVCRRARPQVTFGILWAAIALVPVSNVLIPTGIVVAERTLFLATVGVVIAGSDLLVLLGRKVYDIGSAGRVLATSSLCVLLGMGLTRSWSRQQVWHDLVSLWFQSVIDAPNSYRAHHAYASVLFDVGMRGTAEKHYKIAMQLFPEAWPLYLDLADKYRGAGLCEPALKYYRQVLLLTPAQAGARASEIACLLYIGDYPQAASEARLGISFGIQTKSLELYARIADSADRVHAPPHSVNLPPPVDSAPKR